MLAAYKYGFGANHATYVTLLCRLRLLRSSLGRLVSLVTSKVERDHASKISFYRRSQALETAGNQCFYVVFRLLDKTTLTAVVVYKVERTEAGNCA